MGDGEVCLTIREADRVSVIREVSEKRLRQGEAARRLSLSIRQVKRLVRRYRELGVSGLVSGHRGRRPNNAIDPSVRRAALGLVRERYPDFGPTFACEKLVEAHDFKLSAETLRGWMIADGLWRPKARRGVQAHPSRPRRECLGDLVQIDGSPHDWFEERGPAVHPDRVRGLTRRRGCWRWGFGRRRRPRPTWRRRGRTWRPAGGRWRTTRTATACSG